MSEIIGFLAPLTFSMDGQVNLCFRTKNDCRALYEDFKDKKLMVVVKEYKKKRSLNANAYMWTLIGKLAKKMSIPNEELYRKYVREIGVYKDFDIDDKAVDTLFHIWTSRGIGWFGEKVDKGEHEGFTRVRVYYGSSEYNTKQMSRLADSVVQDCKAVGIETMSPYELEALMSNWNGGDK